MTNRIQNMTIREYKNGDEYAITKLFREIFGREMSIDEWRWKYLGQGNDKVWSFVVVNKNEQLVGHYGGIPLRMKYFDKNMTGVVTCDVMIHRKYRGIWILKALHDCFINAHLKKGVSLFYGFPTKSTLLLPAEKKGLYERVEPVFEASKELTFHSDLDRYLYKMIPLDFDDPRIDALWSSVGKYFRLSIIRDRTYFQWRYKRHVLFDYEIWGLTKRWSNSLIGIAIFRKENSENLLLMDMVFKIKFISLLKQVENLALKIGKKKMFLWLPQRMHPELKMLGFTLRPSGAVLPRSYHPETIKKEELRTNLYYTYGDTDFL